MFRPCVFLDCQYCSQPVEGGFELQNESISFPCRAYALLFLLRMLLVQFYSLQFRIIICIDWNVQQVCMYTMLSW